MKAIIILAAFILSGCSGSMDVLDEYIEKGEGIADDTLNAAADTIDTYCDVVPEAARLELREKVNSRTEKGDIRIDCVP